MHRKLHLEPISGLPHEEGKYNFIQLKLDFHKPGYREIPVLVFSPEPHGKTLQRFFKEYKGFFHYPKMDIDGKKVPAITGRDYQIIGIGTGYSDPKQRVFEVFPLDSSNDYKQFAPMIGLDRNLLEKMVTKQNISVKYK